MAISSSSLIHLTKKKAALVGILKENFKVKYCLEKIITPAGTFEYAIPMVSFCDIPLSQIKEHVVKYGCYGIGLNQEWGRSKGLNPVLYVDRNSSVGANYRQAFLELVGGRKINSASDHEVRLLDVLRYMKNYEADLVRGKNTDHNYRFADEKEWRYVPDKSQCQFLVSGKTYQELGVKARVQKMTASIRLSFDPSDIKYIIIKDESEISEFIQILRTAKGKNYSLDDVERLMTRIITVDQIKTDF